VSVLPNIYAPLREELLAAAAAFASEAQPLAELLSGLVDDVERAMAEPLAIFPVCHHSPSSAVHMVRRLSTNPPRVIYMECCEDLRPVLEGVRECKLPIALQAFAARGEAFPRSWAPLNLVCPLTEFSAEFQAIAFALENPSTELVFVDRSCDHVFQWMPQQEGELEKHLPPDAPSDAAAGDSDDKDDAALHGSAVGVEVGSLQPTFGQFRAFLLQNARVKHFSEWWDQYVEQAIIGNDYANYRQVMFLVGSLIRRLGQCEEDHAVNEKRERFMWTRIKEHLRKNKIAPKDAMYICGAAHSASRVAEFGTTNDLVWELPPRTDTQWLYGLVPSSYVAIEHQFAHPNGAVSLAESVWERAIRQQGLKPFKLAEKKTKPAKTVRSGTKSAASATPPAAEETGKGGGLLGYMTQAPPPVAENEEELLRHCVDIVALARRNGYLASTADSIAIYQTSILLANMRNRRHPSPYDFRDAAITCLEKDRTPKKRNVSRICDILLGGDRTGRVGYESMPPLARDVYDRLKALPVNLEAHTIQRALLDFRKKPEWLPCSDMLWKLRYLLASDVVRPIMGQRELGQVPQQESWDIAIGKYQGAVIQLGYEGVTVEHVLERRLKQNAFGADAKTVAALAAAEDSLLFLKSERLTEELGERAVALLTQEEGVESAQEIFTRINRLVHHYRSTPGGLPPWIRQFVTTGYSHYATLLPTAFGDRGTTPAQIAAMMSFIFTLESLALSLGCQRSQLAIAIQQAASVTEDPAKKSLLWSAECLLQKRDLASLRAFFDDLMENRLALEALPEYLTGFLLALSFTPLMAGVTVELMSKAFARLPDEVLMPWLPRLIMLLRPHARTALPVLLKEATAVYPGTLAALAGWSEPWEAQKIPTPTGTGKSGDIAPSIGSLGPEQVAVRRMLATFPATTNALAAALGVDARWTEAKKSGSDSANSTHVSRTANGSPAAELLKRHPATLKALAAALER
jgi:hypothetical protein